MEPDQLASQKLVDLDLRCFDNSIYSNDYFHLFSFRIVCCVCLERGHLLE